MKYMTFFANWNSADWIQISLSILLFAVGYWLGRKQTRITIHVEELAEKQENILHQVGELAGSMHILQSAIAELEIREKIGVINRGIHEVAKRNLGITHTLFSDCLAVLPLFEFASDDLQCEYLQALGRAICSLHKKEDAEGNSLQHILTSNEI